MIDIKEKSENLSIFAFSDPVGARTQNLQLRRLLLYPVELRNQACFRRLKGGLNDQHAIKLRKSNTNFPNLQITNPYFGAYFNELQPLFLPTPGAKPPSKHHISTIMTPEKLKTSLKFELLAQFFITLHSNIGKVGIIFQFLEHNYTLSLLGGGSIY